MDMPTKEATLPTAALAIATEAHADQTDRGGTPYIEHLLTVAAFAADTLRTEPRNGSYLQWGDDLLAQDVGTIKAIALLHDTLEDAPDEAERLARYGRIERECGRGIARAVAALTRDPNETYAEYIAQVASKPWLIRVVKRADLRHNGDLSRLGHAPTAADLQRADKYAVAERLLARCGTV